MSAIAITLTPAEIRALSATFDTSDAMFAKRVRLIHSHVKAGMTVKGIRENMLAERANDGRIVVVAETIFGYAKHVADVVMSLSDDVVLAAVDNKVLADMARAFNKIGHKGTSQAALDEILAPLTCDVEGKLAALGEWAAAIVADGIPVPEKKSRAARPDAGEDSDDDAGEPAPVVTLAAELTERDALAQLHAVAEWIRRGGAYSADLESAVADVVNATSTARKRSRAMVAA